MSYKYILKFDSGEEQVIDIQLDPSTYTAIPHKDTDLPDWALLEFGKCPICPFTAAQHKYCPIARNLAWITKTFSDKASTVMVDARVISKEREYFKHISLQGALSSAIGLYMATSGCPKMNFLKPMAKYHLPFASLNETIYRSVSTYLLQQYFRKKNGQEPDWDLNDLNKAYETITALNLAIVDRVRKASQKDANYNALIILDIFAKMVPWSISQGLHEKDFVFKD
ncbi:MAG: hypothetical protein A2X31_00055 [Elusimicrobia bacterium GWB2_63_22]|nr:MAG: hypothetical protein A2X31_00055 [Elusimicrobia bacterium GWB2_63_22]